MVWLPIVLGGGASYLFSRLLSGDTDGGAQRPAAPQLRPGQRLAPTPPALDANLDHATRAGLERLLTGGSPDELDLAANSLLRTGYPLAAHVCAQKAIAMRQFDAQNRAAQAHRERMHAAHAVQQQEIAARLAQDKALAETAARLRGTPGAPPASPQVAAPLNAPSGAAFGQNGAPVPQNVQPGTTSATVAEVSPPAARTDAPPTVATSGAKSSSGARRKPKPAAAEKLNGHGPAASSPDVTEAPAASGDARPADH